MWPPSLPSLQTPLERRNDTRYVQRALIAALGGRRANPESALEGFKAGFTVSTVLGGPLATESDRRDTLENPILGPSPHHRSLKGEL